MKTKDRYSGIQTILGDCYKNGCHFLTILTIAEDYSGKEVDLIEAIRVTQSKKWMNHDFEVTVKGSLALLKLYTGKNWTRREVKELPTDIKDNEYTEVIHHNTRTGFDHYHRRYLDTLINSITVAEGRITKYYIYTVEE